MNRQKYIDKFVGHIDIGDRVVLVRPEKGYKAPITATVLNIFRGHSINFTLDCIDADGKRYQYYNASLGCIKKEGTK